MDFLLLPLGLLAFSLRIMINICMRKLVAGRWRRSAGEVMECLLLCGLAPAGLGQALAYEHNRVT
jgi:hypothetical protein